MRIGNLIVITLTLCIVGCAGRTQTTAAKPQHIQAQVNLEERTYTDRASSALVFTPPIAANLPAMDLSRDGRAPEAFWGFEQGYTTTYDLYIDDRQGAGKGNRDRYLREATSDKVGVILR